MRNLNKKNIIMAFIMVACLVICAVVFYMDRQQKKAIAAENANTKSTVIETLYSSARPVTILDLSGKETADKITVSEALTTNCTKTKLEDWYLNYVLKNNYKAGIIKYTDKAGYGIYADDQNIYVDAKLTQNPKTKAFTQEEAKTIYTCDKTKKTITISPQPTQTPDETPEPTETPEETQETTEENNTEQENTSRNVNQNTNDNNNSQDNASPAQPQAPAQNTNTQHAEEQPKPAQEDNTNTPAEPETNPTDDQSEDAGNDQNPSEDNNQSEPTNTTPEENPEETQETE